MAEIFNAQRVLGVHIVEDGTTMHNGLPVVGVVQVESEAVRFSGNERTLGVAVLEGIETIHNDQPVLGVVLIHDDRKLYNHQLVIPVHAVEGAFGASITYALEDVAEDAEVGSLAVTLGLLNFEGAGYFELLDGTDAELELDEGDTSLGKIASVLDHETKPALTVVVRFVPDEGDPIGPRTFQIPVANVLEVTLVDLVLSADEIDENAAENTEVGDIEGAASGSIVTLIENAGGRFKLSGGKILAGAVPTDYEAATSHEITLRETHPDASNSPHDTVIEIRVLEDGAEPGDITAPTISALTPADNASVAAGEIAALVVTFNEPIQFGDAISIRLYDADDNLIQEWTLDDVLILAVDGDQLEMMLDQPLVPGTDYYVQIDSGSVKDLPGNPFAGIANKTTWNFSVAAQVPSAFAVEYWSIARDDEAADVTISTLPYDGGSAISDIEYRLDGDSWISSGGTSSFTISGLTNNEEYDVEIRAVNSVGAGAASDTKQVTPGTEPEDYVGPGDIVSGARFWYGLRAYSLAACGTPAIRVTNDGGTTQIDINTLEDGSLDVATLAAFIGGGAAKIVTWYDQTGNGRHATQVDDAARAIVALAALGSHPIALGTLSVEYRHNSGVPSTPQPFTISAVMRRTADFTTGQGVLYANGGSGSLEFHSAANTLKMYGGSDAFATGADNTWLAIQALYSGASSIFRVGATENTVSAGTAAAGGSGEVVFHSAGGGRLRGSVQEAGLWPSGFSSGERGLMQVNQAAYWGI